MKCVRCLVFLLAGAIAPAFGADALLWFAAGRPTVEAVQAVEVLASAADQGLDPRDYDAALLSRRLTEARRGPPLPGAAYQLVVRYSRAVVPKAG